MQERPAAQAAALARVCAGSVVRVALEEVQLTASAVVLPPMPVTIAAGRTWGTMEAVEPT